MAIKIRMVTFQGHIKFLRDYRGEFKSIRILIFPVNLCSIVSWPFEWEYNKIVKKKHGGQCTTNAKGMN